MAQQWKLPEAWGGKVVEGELMASQQSVFIAVNGQGILLPASILARVELAPKLPIEPSRGQTVVIYPLGGSPRVWQHSARGWLETGKTSAATWKMVCQAGTPYLLVQGNQVL